MHQVTRSAVFVLILGVATLASGSVQWSETADVDSRAAVAEGLSGPEAVRYDPEQDVYFVSNFNGEAAGDANGFISKVGPDGAIRVLKFMEGTEAHPLHGPRGMQIVGDTLWVADAKGIHGFNRSTGEHTDFVDFTVHEPGFLNDVDAAADGSLYVTDTGNARVFHVSGGEIEVVVSDELTDPPNGITWYAPADAYVLAPWGGGRTILAYRPGDGATTGLAEMSEGGNFDGVEEYYGRLLIASQADQAIWAWQDGEAHKLIATPGKPADIGIDTKRKRIAVPYIALDRVDIWQLPEEK